MFAIHAVVMELLRVFKIKHFSLVSAILGNIFFVIKLGLPCAIFILVKTCSCYIIARRKKKLYIWISIFFWMALNNMKFFEDFSINYLKLADRQIYYFYVSIGWNSLRSISFVMDELASNGKGLFYSFVDYMGFVYYPPTLFIGPFVLYERYRQMLLNFGTTSGVSVFSRVLKLLRTLTHLWLLFLLTQYALHYFYINNIMFYPHQILPRMTSFGIYGYGYLMGQLFHHKYVIFYGLSLALATFDNIVVQERPRCIARTHKYTDMWKYFDRGLYEFLFKYIYAQLCTKTSGQVRRLCAMLTTFVFIYLWHGFANYIFVWAALNFVCVLVENFWTAVTSSKKYNQLLGRYLGPNNVMRFNTVIATNIMIPSILSNFIFFADIPVGYEFFKLTYTSGLGHYLRLWVFSYAIYNASEFISKWEKSKQLKKSDKLKTID